MRPKPGEYRKKAQDDIDIIELTSKQDYRPFGATCFHSQQMAEKIAKDKLVELGRNPRYSHSIELLLGDVMFILCEDDSEILRCARFLDSLYTETRYPGSDVTIEEETAEYTVECAWRIVDWIDSCGKPGTQM